MPLNVEIKAPCADPARIEALLLAQGARFAGTDGQRDTYFAVPKGRLKLRQGNIENALIYYARPETQGLKTSEVQLFPVAEQSEALEALLREALGLKVVVQKQRRIFFLDNVKFHLDEVEALGSFVEIEAIDAQGLRSEAELSAQCRYYLEMFGLNEADCIAQSYSDMLLGGR
jgi:adenylate cyclase, class 2